MRELRVGIIGCGSIGRKHIKAIIDNQEHLVLTALSDISLENAQKLRETHVKLTCTKYNTAVYSDYRKMIEKEKLDIVSVLTESGKHYPIALDCIERGINVLVEKPLALSLEHVDILITSAIRNNVKLGVIHQHRFNPIISNLKETIDAGSFNNLFYGVTNIRWNRNHDYYEKAKWRGTIGSDGGILMNQCIHNIDLLQWLLKEQAEEVFAYKQNYMHPYIQTEDTVLALIKFAGGILGIIEGTVSTFPHNLENSISVFGEKGSVKIGGKCLNEVEIWIFDEGDTGRPELFQDGSMDYSYHSEVYRDFIKAMNSGREPMVNGKEARKSIEIILAIQQSARSGLPVKLPLKEGIINYGD